MVYFITKNKFTFIQFSSQYRYIIYVSEDNDTDREQVLKRRWKKGFFNMQVQLHFPIDLTFSVNTTISHGYMDSHILSAKFECCLCMFLNCLPTLTPFQKVPRIPIGKTYKNVNVSWITFRLTQISVVYDRPIKTLLVPATSNWVFNIYIQ